MWFLCLLWIRYGRGIAMRLNPNFPDEVYGRAHAEYPNAVARKGLYAMAFFGHGRPKDLDHKETCESVWRGLVRKYLSLYVKGDSDD